jgi:hypothetical protein
LSADISVEWVDSLAVRAAQHRDWSKAAERDRDATLAAAHRRLAAGYDGLVTHYRQLLARCLVATPDGGTVDAAGQMALF